MQFPLEHTARCHLARSKRNCGQTLLMTRFHLPFRLASQVTIDFRSCELNLLETDGGTGFKSASGIVFYDTLSAICVKLMCSQLNWVGMQWTILEILRGDSFQLNWRPFHDARLVFAAGTSLIFSESVMYVSPLIKSRMFSSDVVVLFISDDRLISWLITITLPFCQFRGKVGRFFINVIVIPLANIAHLLWRH